MMAVLLGLRLAERGLDAAAIGIVVSAGLAGAATASLVATVAGDGFGRRRALVLLAVFGALGAAAASVAAHPWAIALAAFVGMLNGMGRDRGASLVLEQAALPATTADAGRTMVFARYNVLQDVGHAVGSLLAGLPVLGAHAFPAYVVLIAAAIPLYARLSPRIESPTRAAGPSLSPESRRIVARLCALFALDSLGGGFLTTALLALFFHQRFGVGEAGLAALFFGARAANAVSHLAAAWLAARFGLVNTMVFTHIPSSLLLVFDYRFRRQALGFEPKGDAAEALRVISPRDKTALFVVAAAHPKGAPIADLEKKLGVRIDYDLTLLGELTRAAGDDRPQIELLGRRRCAAGPRWCGNLGYFLAEEGRDEEAEVAVRKTFDNAADRVGATWYATWLVRHYVARGRVKDAAAVAEEAASTGSAGGMVAMAEFLEHQKRFEEAERMLIAERARYGDDAHADPPEENDGDALIAFYHRMANVRGDKAYAERFQALAGRWFPNGLEKLDPAALDPGSAREGVAVLKASSTTRRVGLRPGDVIVGVDGYRVRTLRQYLVVRGFRPDMEMELHIWRYPGFQPVKTRSWYRWLDTDLRTNVPGEPTAPG